MTEQSPVSESSTARLLDHAAEVIRLVASIKAREVDAILALLRLTRENGGTVFLAGNGGSAANASHCAMHLRECGVRALC
ncbi:MAG: SIS domain-containing protein, partial [Chloroflexota bacterium]|nr:SIS domain-containing protein [Chloroflexota bacterium]